MNPPAREGNPSHIRGSGSDPEIRAVIISGKGSCFTGGIDSIEMAMELPELMDKEQKKAASNGA
ncbi:MAG: hypothetical protein R2861_04050 [Desulfobacterales bacterium]